MYINDDFNTLCLTFINKWEHRIFLCVIYYDSYCSIQANKYNLKHGKGVTRKFGNTVLAQEETIFSLLFWTSFLHRGSGADFDSCWSDLRIVSRREVLHQDEEDDDHEGKEESEEEPDVDELHVGRCRELRGDGLVEGVHHQHARDGHRDARLEMLFLEISCRLQKEGDQLM